MCQIDGGNNMHGAEKVLVEQIFKSHGNAKCLKPMVIHCVIHQQVHYGKHFNLSCVIEPVVNGKFYSLLCTESLSVLKTEYLDLLKLFIQK